MVYKESKIEFTCFFPEKRKYRKIFNCAYEHKSNENVRQKHAGKIGCKQHAGAS